MAITKMLKLSVVTLAGEKQKLLDEVVRLGCVHVGQSLIDSPVNHEDVDKLEDNINTLSNAMRIINSTVNEFNTSTEKFFNPVPLPYCLALGSDVEFCPQKLTVPTPSMARPRTELTFDEFEAMAEQADNLLEDARQVQSLTEQADNCTQELNAVAEQKKKLELYLPLTEKISYFSDTAHTYLCLGVVPNENLSNLVKEIDNNELSSISVVNSNNSETLVVVACHKSEKDLWQSLAQYGLHRADIAEDNPNEKYEQLCNREDQLRDEVKTCKTQLLTYLSKYEQFNLMCDWFALAIKQAQAEGTFSKTAKTVLMTAYMPAENKDEVASAIEQISEYLIMQIDEIAEDEFAPTQCVNNGVVQPFESVTNMYSAPNYHEPDPNPAMSLFYFLIFGLMTADIGYGMLLVIAGFALSAIIKQNTGTKMLAKLIGTCGFGTILWGAVFGSFFALDVATFIPNCPDWYPLLPSPIYHPIITIMLSLLMGILHLMLATACNAYKMLKRKDIAGALFDCLPWEIFFAGLILTAAKPACDMIATPETLSAADVTQPIIHAMANIPDLTGTGLIVMAVALIIVALTAGRNNKGIIGKFTGGFGGVYGVINYFSDVVSYVRIFGLMLSGAVFGMVVDRLVEMIFGAGIIGYIFGMVVFLGFHVFNLVLSVLGAYVHNARLQYVEYFGKFYEGEGQLFVPLGSDLDHVLIKGIIK